MTPQSEKFWNPYFAGIALGLVLLATYLVMGRGLGASGAATRIGVTIADVVATKHVDANPNMAHFKEGGAHPLDDWLVFEIFGAFLGGIVASITAGRFKWGVIKGSNISVKGRLFFAAFGGVIMGVGARFARGCASGQGLTGGALLSVGGWIFMLSLFAGGYALARVMRRQWL